MIGLVLFAILLWNCGFDLNSKYMCKSCWSNKTLKENTLPWMVQYSQVWYQLLEHNYNGVLIPCPSCSAIFVGSSSGILILNWRTQTSDSHGTHGLFSMLPDYNNLSWHCSIYLLTIVHFIQALKLKFLSWVVESKPFLTSMWKQPNSYILATS